MEHFKELKATKIFKDADEFDCQAMMFCFKTRFKTFLKNEPILKQGEPVDEVAIILKGAGIVEHCDTLGNISIVLEMKPGDIFGVENAYTGNEFYLDSLIATEKTLVMFMNKHRLITPCENKCKRHDLVIKNVMNQLASRSLELTNKLIHMSKKSIRDKLLSYFSHEADKTNSQYFEIPFNKTELANYLSVDRSAMSTELSKMRDEGIIDYDKKEYRLIKKKAE